MTNPQSTPDPVPWILRRDVEIFPADEALGGWTLKDPVRLAYFRVDTAELEFLRQLDGRRTAAGIVSQLQEQFPTLTFSTVNLAQFLMTAVRAGLLIPAAPGYASQLVAQTRQNRERARFLKLFSLLSHRFRGVDPHRFLQWLDQKVGWLYHSRVLQTACLFILFTTVLVLSRWSQLTVELPAMHELLTLQTMLMLAGIVMVIKVLHEVGHGLTCCHYGGECHEMGCILVGFLPLLYCDVSDSWRDQHRIRRMQVAAAGIAVELLVAAVFGILWMTSVPGFLHSLFLNVMLVCSLNTVLVNGNPLLRYDGYYVLSDALQFPNLGPQSRAAAGGLLDRLILGLPRTDLSRWTGLRRFGVPAFGFASSAYRLVILVSILLLVHTALRSYGLESLAWVLAASTAGGLVLATVQSVRRRWHVIRSSGARRRRAATGLMVTLTVGTAGLCWPWPYAIHVPFTLTPGVNTPIYVAAPGSVEQAVTYGSQLKPDQQLAHLHNPQLAARVARLEGELTLRQARLQHLTSSRSQLPNSAAALPAAQQAVHHTAARLRTATQHTTRLDLHNPHAGQLYPPRPVRSVGPSLHAQHFWQGLPLAEENQTAWLEEQTLLGWVGSVPNFRAHAYVPQQSVEFIRDGSHVRLTFHSRPGSPWQGTVSRITGQPAVTVPPELASTGKLAVNLRDETLAGSHFVVHIQLQPQHTPSPPLYSTGWARIECPPRSVAARLWRVLTHTFAFQL